MTDHNAFLEKLSHDAQHVEQYITAALESQSMPPRLAAAMGYGVLGGGKRLRPFLLLETLRCLGKNPDDSAFRAASALETIHSYSLVHDDLPAMDNDALRRGQPTVHCAFDEATAILAGDALLTFAFELLGGATTPHIAKLVGMLAKAAGGSGMVGGQILDLEAEGRFAQGLPLALSADAIMHMQALKTGALIAAAVDMGAVLGDANDAECAALGYYAKTIGLAFQIADDLLDVEGDAHFMGKAVGKDNALGKGTLVTLWGMERARTFCDDCVAEAEAALGIFGEKAKMLRQAAQFIASRNH